MGYNSLGACVQDLERHGQLVRINDAVDPYLEMAAIHLRVHEAGGPALLFEQVKGSKYRAVSNIFGTMERCRFMFRDTLPKVQRMIQLRNHPQVAIKQPWRYINDGLTALTALPKRTKFQPAQWQEISIADLPQIVHWVKDGGAFVTLPQVYTEDVDKPGIMQSNIGMYRIQLSGNDYVPNTEIGLHYQLHRGIGVHQTKAWNQGKDLKVSCFVGGPPAHTVAAVMPLPEGISEATFAGVLGGKRFSYAYNNGFAISNDADFVITGKVINGAQNKPEGPFGDHLGYYSLTHPFPVIQVEKVYAKKNALWAFTVVGRPPQEDTGFGNLIHELTGDAIPKEIPGLKEIHAVDAAGVHPLLLAVGSERYTPYLKSKRPSELLTIANRVLGTGQLSLAKYLFIAASDKALSCHQELPFLEYVLERLDTNRDVHFYTKTSIDTLDYSGSDLNEGSKVVFAAMGEPIRVLSSEVPAVFNVLSHFKKPTLPMKGVVALEAPTYNSAKQAQQDYEQLNQQLADRLGELQGIAMIVLVDDSAFTAAQFKNFLWVTFTRSNPAHDIQGIGAFVEHKHWGSSGPLIIDARIKPHHAPVLEKDPEVERRIDKLFQKGGVLAPWG